MRRKVLFAILSLFLLLPLAKLMAQEQKVVELSGYVLDRERKPIPMATVHVKGTAIATICSLKGYYSLKLKPTQDKVVIVYSMLGYKKAERQLPKLLSSKKINVELGEDARMIESVIVEGKQKKGERMQTLSPNKIKLQTGPANNIESVVSTLSGVVQKNELSNQYNVRGGNFDENLVYINRVEIYRPLLARSAEQEGLSAINPDLVSRVLFSAGGFTADYGDKLSSVLDITYRKPEKTEGSINLGMLQSSLHYGGQYKKLSHISGVRFKRIASLLSTLDTKGAYDPIFFDAQSFINYSINPKLKLSLLANISSTSYRFRPISRKTSFGTLQNSKQLNISFDGKEEDRFKTYLTALNLDYIPNAESRHHLSLSAFSSAEREAYDIASEYLLENPQGQGDDTKEPILGGHNIPQLKDESSALGIGRSRNHARNSMYYSVLSLRTLSQHRLAEKYALRYGLELKLNKVEEATSEWTQRDSLGYTTPLNKELLLANTLLKGQHKLNSLSLAVFLEGKAKFQINDWGQVKTNLGLRASYWSYNKELNLSPRLNISLLPEHNKSLAYRLATGVYYQTPFYREILQEEAYGHGAYRTKLNKHIKSQAAAIALFGIDYDFKLIGRRFKLSSEVYAKYLWHLNPYKQENIKLKYMGQNNGRAYIIGLDTKLYGEFVQGQDSWLSLSLTQARQSIGSKDFDLPLMNAPVLSTSLFFQDYFPNYKPIRLSLRAVYSTGLPIMQNGTGYQKVAFTSSPYKRVDIGMIYRISQRANGESYRWAKGFNIDLALDVFNLFDMLNTSSYYWVRDAYNINYAVPNYLTRRSWNLSLKFSF